MQTAEPRESAMREALAGLAAVEVRTPYGFVERVLKGLDAEASARRRSARLIVIRTRERVWGAGHRVAGVADRMRRTPALRNGALASSAIVMGAVALGLEARHVRRSREAA
jgi:hypothetical protein